MNLTSSKPAAQEAQVLETLPNLLYQLKLENGEAVIAHIAGEMRLHAVRLLTGDRVMVEVSPFTPGRGRIIRRL